MNASANFYSLIETAKAHGLEPNAYLREVFTTVLPATIVEALLQGRFEDSHIKIALNKGVIGLALTNEPFGCRVGKPLVPKHPRSSTLSYRVRVPRLTLK